MSNLFSEKPIVKVVMLKGQDGKDGKDKLINQADGSGLSFWIGTRAEYEAIPETELINNCVYYITDDTRDDYNTRLNELDTKVDNNATAITNILSRLAGQTLFDGTPIYAGDSDPTFTVPKGLMAQYKLFAVSIADVATIQGAVDLHTFLVFRDELIEDPFIVKFDFADVVVNSGTLEASSYTVFINEVPGTDTEDKFDFNGFRSTTNLTSGAVTNTKFYLHKIVGII